jgi:S-methylmethionine-dependent homocysteine/selenocysteine methylase
MSRGQTHRPLPQLSGPRFITDGGIETDLIFHHGLDLPHFAAFVLLDDPDGERALRAYYAQYIALADEHGMGLVLDTPTWRASEEWGALLGYSPDALVDVNRRAVALLEDLRSDAPSVVVSGCVGPRADGYDPADHMTAAAAEAYHAAQIRTFAATTADMVTALTLTHTEEAVGIVRAAAAAGIPIAVSFTVETDGHLASGRPLLEAIEQVDADTEGAAAYFMVNCAHPTHFAHVLLEGGAAVTRIRGLRANASSRSHAELDESDELDEGDPLDLAERYRELSARLPQLTVLGGCCGTDRRHIAAICDAQAT